MAQFQVYRNPSRTTADRAPYLLDVQSDLVSVKARVIVMLVTPQYFGERMRHLNPVLSVNGQDLVMSPSEIGAIQERHLGPPVSDLGSQRSVITAAMAFLLTGI
jgi:toxin CcdB